VDVTRSAAAAVSARIDTTLDDFVNEVLFFIEGQSSCSASAREWLDVATA